MGIAKLATSVAHNHESRNPFHICREEGIFVLRHPISGFRGYRIAEDGHEFIIIKDDLPNPVAKFVCAHELGHYYLHRRMNRVFMDKCTHMLPGRFENEADKFAVHLLFGDAPLYQEAISDWEMADILNVPKCNVNARLIELGIYH